LLGSILSDRGELFALLVTIVADRGSLSGLRTAKSSLRATKLSCLAMMFRDGGSQSTDGRTRLVDRVSVFALRAKRPALSEMRLPYVEMMSPEGGAADGRPCTFVGHRSGQTSSSAMTLRDRVVEDADRRDILAFWGGEPDERKKIDRTPVDFFGNRTSSGTLLK
jgi:hypothetical protein